MNKKEPRISKLQVFLKTEWRTVIEHSNQVKKRSVRFLFFSIDEKFNLNLFKIQFIWLG